MSAKKAVLAKFGATNLENAAVRFCSLKKLFQVYEIGFLSGDVHFQPTVEIEQYTEVRSDVVKKYLRNL